MNDRVPPVSAAWIDPVSVDPKLLVNREYERRKLYELVSDSIRNNVRSARFQVSGDRGSGKSILSRAVLADLSRDFGSKIVPLAIDSRSLRYRSFLDLVARQLSSLLLERARSEGRSELLLPFAQLGLLAYKNKLSRNELVSVNQQYGLTLGAGTSKFTDLLASLEAKFSWQRARTETSSFGEETTVTDELLESAISAVLTILVREKLPWFVVMFYDDLDQALPSGDEVSLEAMFRRVIELAPCIAILHIRTEALIENLTRECNEVVELEPVTPDVLMLILQQRRMSAVAEIRAELDKQITDFDHEQFRRLAEVAPSTLVFLRWVQALLREAKQLPLPPDWSSDARLARLARANYPYAGDQSDLDALARAVDRCSRSGSRYVRRDDLLSDALGEERLSMDLIERLERAQMILPRFRFQPSGEVLLQPMYELLRPSVQARLRRK